jgi:hypothetical protein
VTLKFCDTKDLLVRKQLACLKELPTSTSIFIYKQWHLLMHCSSVPSMKRTLRQETVKIDPVQQRLSEMLFGSLCLTRMCGTLPRLQVGRLSNRGSITGRGKTITRPLVRPTQPFIKPYWRLFPGRYSGWGVKLTNPLHLECERLPYLRARVSSCAEDNFTSTLNSYLLHGAESFLRS